MPRITLLQSSPQYETTTSLRNSKEIHRKSTTHQTHMIEINNITNFTVDKKRFLALAKKVLKGENREKENLSIAFVNAKEIQKLNKVYHKQDKPTDVLSFAKLSQIKEDFGEVVICPEVVKKNAKEDKTDFKQELQKMLVHGILHILGYDHEISTAEEKKMFAKQNYYL